MTSEYPDFVFVVYDGDTSDQTYDITVSCEAGTLVGKPVKYIRHDLNTRAVPDVPELVRYALLSSTNYDFDGTDLGSSEYMCENKYGEYVLYDQAAAIIEAKDAEIERLENSNAHWINENRKNLKNGQTSEAKNTELEAAWLNAEGKITDLEHKLAQREAGAREELEKQKMEKM